MNELSPPIRAYLETHRLRKPVVLTSAAQLTEGTVYSLPSGELVTALRRVMVGQPATDRWYWFLGGEERGFVIRDDGSIVVTLVRATPPRTAPLAGWPTDFILADLLPNTWPAAEPPPPRQLGE